MEQDEGKKTSPEFSKTVPGTPKTTFQWVLLAITLIAVWFFYDGRPWLSGSVRQYAGAAPTLSPDNKKIVFSLDADGQSDIGIYDIESGTLRKLNPTGKRCRAPMCSPDGTMITFISFDKESSNVFVMNTDGTNMRQLTYTHKNRNLKDEKIPSYKKYEINDLPSFSHDSRKIIFIRSRVIRQRSMGGEMVSHWDYYEVDIKTGQEKQLTDYRFFTARRPFYLPNGQGFIFSADGATGDIPEEMQAKNGNEILIMNRKRPYPYRPFEHDTYAVRPTSSSNGHIAFVSRTNQYDGNKEAYTYDIFLWVGGKAQRITKEMFSSISEPCMSFDGSLVVFLASKDRDKGHALWLAKTDGSEVKYLGYPWSSKLPTNTIN